MSATLRRASAAIRGHSSFEQLNFLIALERERDPDRAASACQTSSAVLIGGIRQIEADVGGRILVAETGFEGLTPLGIRLAAWAHNLLRDFRRVYG